MAIDYSTVPKWSDYGGDLPFYRPADIRFWVGGASRGNQQDIDKINKIVAVSGSVDKYLEQQKKYLEAKTDWDKANLPAEDAERWSGYQSGIAEKATIVQEDLIAQEKALEEAKKNQYNKLRSELETQYNNLVAADSRFGYRGRSSDLPTVFNQQAAQLAAAGVTSIGNLRIQDGKLIDNATGKAVSTSNLGGQVYSDRDTGVQKWGDIFSGVKGGANYGIMQAPDGSVLLFPAYEKSKSLAAQIGGKELEKWITPLLTVGGAVVGVPGLGAVGGAAAGAAAGSTTGQLLASGKVDWEKVALSAAGAGAGEYVSGLLTGGEAAAGSGLTPSAGGETGLLPSAGGVTGITPPPGFQLAPEVGAGIGTTPSLLGPSEIDLLGGTDFSKIGETGLTPGAAGEGIQVVVPPGGGAATIPGLEAPGLSAMGGAQGITVPVQGGVVSELGFVPAGATPALGDPSSFINNPDYLGSPVISEDYLGLTASDMPSTVNIQDALRMARTGMQLFGPQQQQLLGMGGYGGGGGQAAGVDSSGLLALLQGRAGVPGVSPLLAPVVNPYQPLLGTTTQSLLG